MSESNQAPDVTSDGKAAARSVGGERSGRYGGDVLESNMPAMVSAAVTGIGKWMKETGTTQFVIKRDGDSINAECT